MWSIAVKFFRPSPEPPRCQKRVCKSAALNLLDIDYRSHSPLLTLWQLADLRWWQVLWYLLVFMAKTSPVWAWPLVLAGVVGQLESPGPYGVLWIGCLGAVMFSLLVYNIPGHLWYIRLMSRHIRSVELRLRSALVRRLQQLSIHFHHGTESGRLYTKVVRDVEQVENLSRVVLQNGLESALNLIFAMGLALWHRPVIALFYVLATPICVILTRAFRSIIRRRNQEYREGVEAMGARVSEMIDMIPVTRAHGVEHVEVQAVESHLFNLRDRAIQLDMSTAMFQASTWVTMFMTQLLGLMVFAAMVHYGKLSVAGLVLYMALFAQIVGSVMMMLNLYPQIAKGLESVKSLGEVLECPDLEQNAGKPKVDRVIGKVRFDRVTFGYDQEDRPALRDFSLDVFPGECVAFVGESGSGKSTAMNLLIGFYRPSAGRILVDDVDMQKIDLRTWRSHVAVVPQQTVLFGGSLRDNITYGLQQVDEQKLQEVIDAANLRSVIDQMPRGLDSQIGENGVQLSGGQRQRISIARALIRDPKLIILDEATSALDVISEREVQEAIDRLVADRTTFIVAHRLSTIRNADRVVVLKQGRVVEVGSQDELMEGGGEFARLKMLQM